MGRAPARRRARPASRSSTRVRFQGSHISRAAGLFASFARTARRGPWHAGLPGLRAGHALRRWQADAIELKKKNGFLLPVEEVDPEKTRALWINYPHNPTGATATYEYLEEVAGFCRKHDILLFSDECYNDIYSGEPPPSILEVTKERTLAFCSLSKRSGMTGYRSAMMAGDPELIAALKKLRPSIGSPPPPRLFRTRPRLPGQTIGTSKNGGGSSTRSGRCFVDFFERVGLNFQTTDASFYLWVAVPGGDDEIICDAAVGAGYRGCAGPGFRAGRRRLRAGWLSCQAWKSAGRLYHCGRSWRAREDI